MRGVAAARRGARCLGRHTAGALQAPLSTPGARLHLRAASVGVVETLKAPQYLKVPIVQESESAVLADMPDLALAGSSHTSAGGAASAYTGLALDVAISQEGGGAALEAQEALQVVQPETRFGELANGVRVVAQDRQGMCSSVGLFIHSGSRYVPAEIACVPHALELMAFKSSAHLSHLRTLKTLEQLGAVAACRVGRDDLLYQFDTLREYVPIVLPLMMANVLCPSILEEELVAAQEQALEMRNNFETNVEGLLAELLHTTAYKGNTLGNPLYAEERDAGKFTAENIRAYLQKECRPENMIVVGVNTDFDELCKWTARSFVDCQVAQGGEAVPESSGPARDIQKAVYTGGDCRLDRQNPLCHMMIGWEVEGGWNGSMLAAITVLQMFLGGGGSFSTGGPGKGMHTRLYTEVLNRHHWVESCQASSVMYADSGLFTVYATVVPQHAGDFVTVLHNIFKGLSRIQPEELRRAKNALKSNIHMNLEMRAVMMEDIGRQLVLSGKVGTAQEFGRIVDAVTVQDLLDTLQACLKKAPTVVAYGAVDRVPDYDRIKEVFSHAAPTQR